MNFGDITVSNLYGYGTICVQIPDSNAREALLPLADLYEWASGPYYKDIIPEDIEYPVYIRLNLNFRFVGWQDRILEIDQPYQQEYHNAIPYTDFLKLTGFEATKPYEYW